MKLFNLEIYESLISYIHLLKINSQEYKGFYFLILLQENILLKCKEFCYFKYQISILFLLLTLRVFFFLMKRYLGT